MEYLSVVIVAGALHSTVVNSGPARDVVGKRALEQYGLRTLRHRLPPPDPGAIPSGVLKWGSPASATASFVTTIEPLR